MVEPTGYTALDIIGFTDKGPYDPTANYVKNDLVHVGNSTWRCKIDDTTGITPTEGANWTIFIESATSLAGMSDVDLNNPTDDDGLVYDSTSQKWKNKPVVTGDLWVNNGAHNLLPFPYYSGGTQVISGFTLTVNDNGTMVASGTANEANRFNLYVGKLPKNTYKFRFNGSLSGANIAIYDYVTEQVIDSAGANEDITLTVDATNENHNFLLYINWSSGSISISGGPLLRLATDPSTTYTPYAKTNRELTDGRIKYMDITLNNPSTDTAYGGMYEFDYRMNLSGHTVLSANIIDYSGLSKMVMLSAGSDDILRIFSATSGSIATSLDIRIAYI